MDAVNKIMNKSMYRSDNTAQIKNKFYSRSTIVTLFRVTWYSGGPIRSELALTRCSQKGKHMVECQQSDYACGHASN